MVPQLKQIDLLLKAKQNWNSVLAERSNSLGHGWVKNDDIRVLRSIRQKSQNYSIQADKNDEFSSLFSSDHPVTKKLFSADLGKKVGDITKANKIGCKILGNDG